MTAQHFQNMESGTQLGHYTISSLIGKGGMGEVYRAKDEKLGRQVAIKVLPEEFTKDEERVARFQREAKLLASLNHPNIAAIHGLEEDDGTHFLVLELVEGDTLADRIKSGPIAVEESLTLALQIAEALEAAHEKGVIHRDLKPANVKVTPEGKIKVLDFGLAKALEGDSANLNLSNSPTISMAATQQGVILGTAAYMSPEQARGVEVDKRADIWAYGCLLYEMLTGRQAFRGELMSDVMASVLKSNPSYQGLPPAIHPQIKSVLRRCLEKDPKNRYRDIGDVSYELRQVEADPSGSWVETPAGVVQAVPQSKLPWVAAIVLAIVAGVAVWTLKPEAPGPVTRFSHVLPESQQLASLGAQRALAISEDGSKLVYVANNQLYLRAMDTLESSPIPGTEEDPTNPFFSPDGQWIGYQSRADEQLKKIAVGGGTAVTLANVPNTLGPPRWGTDGYIVFTRPEGLVRVSANGGTPEILVEGAGLGAPQILPDGETALGTLIGQIGLLHESGEQEALFAGGRARYARTGHIIYGLEGVLFAVPFDPETLEVVGGPVPLVEGVRFDGNFPQYDLSDSGSLAYVRGDFAADSYVLALVDRDGVTETLDVPPQEYYAPRISPDGTGLAVEVRDGDESGIFVYDLSGNTNIRRLTQTLEGNNMLPLWTVDSERVTFTSDRDGTLAIYWQSADGTDLAERLFLAEEGTSDLFLTGWSPDGRTLAFTMDTTGSDRSLWTLSLDGGAEPEATLFYDVPDRDEYSATFSPDGNWLAYSAADPRAVFVQPFPSTGSIYQVTEDGLAGRKPLWSADGTELFYQRNNPTRLAAVDITTVGGITNGSERPFPIQGFSDSAGYRGYDTTPDSQQFVAAFPVGQAEADALAQTQINIVLNWFEELKERVPVP